MRYLGLLLVFLASMAHAVLPDEVLKDPAKEALARKISQEIRCMVCQNQSIDDSDAPLAKDLRLLVRERVMLGEGEANVKAYLRTRYGDFILLKPPFSMQTILLWFLPFLALLFGGFFLFRLSKQRVKDDLSEEEQQKINEIMQK